MLALSLISSFSPCFSKPDCQFGYGPLWEWRGCQMFILESNNSQMSIYSPISGQSQGIKEKSSNKQWFATIWFLPWVFNTPSLLWQSVLSQRGLINPSSFISCPPLPAPHPLCESPHPGQLCEPEPEPKESPSFSSSPSLVIQPIAGACRFYLSSSTAFQPAASQATVLLEPAYHI